MSNTSAAPKCIGIIMDGNRRWAKARGENSLAGHTAGYKKLKEIVLLAEEAGVRHLIFYAFSTENWKRSGMEVSFLLSLLADALEEELKNVQNSSTRFRFIGEREHFDERLRSAQGRLEEATRDKNGITVVLALSYGGRREIVAAVNALLVESDRGAIDEPMFVEQLSTKGIPDPDIIIRTGGEKRLSNFLLWQGAYAELFFSDTLWPDFSKEEFLKILQEYAARERRFGA